MPKVNLNLTEAESLKPIPEDKYPARVIASGKVESGPKAHYVPIICAVDGGDHDGRKFTVNLPIEGKGAGIFVDFWNKAKGTDYDVDELSELALDTDELVGAPIGLQIGDNEYPEGSGEIRSQVERTYSLLEQASERR